MSERRPTPPRRLRFREEDFNAPPAADDMLGEVAWKLAQEQARERYHRRAARAWTLASVVCTCAAVAVLVWASVWPVAAAVLSLAVAWGIQRVGRP